MHEPACTHCSQLGSLPDLAAGLDHTLERSWDDAVCWFGEGRPVRLGRGYGRVSRRKLREHLAKICSDSGRLCHHLPAIVLVIPGVTFSERQESVSK
jgi:hypothetical protein